MNSNTDERLKRNMDKLINIIQGEQAKGFTHAGRFHADDVFSTALLLYLNSDFQIERGNQVPENYDGIVYDIGRGCFDHHQNNSEIRENGIPYASFGLLWRELGAYILGEELSKKFDEEFVQPLDLNDNTGEPEELAALIGEFNPSWDSNDESDLSFYQAVGFAGMILENKFARLKSSENASKELQKYLKDEKNNILILPKYIPFQNNLLSTDVKFVIFPSNRGGYCIQPVKKKAGSAYRCCFPDSWLGLDREALRQTSGISSAMFCHKTGFIMTTMELADAQEACRISIERYRDAVKLVVLCENATQQQLITEQINKSGYFNTDESPIELHPFIIPVEQYEQLLNSFDKVSSCNLCITKDFRQINKEFISKLESIRPEAVVLDGTAKYLYSIIQMLKKKRIDIYVPYNMDEKVGFIKLY